MNFNASLPLLVMFGIDHTLWPFRAHFLTPPFVKQSNGQILDKDGFNVTCYLEVPAVFQRLKDLSIKIALGTTSIDIKITQELLNLLDLEKYISFREFERGFYDGMFESIQKQSYIRYEDMLFFDDYDYNIETMEKEGVLGIVVPKGGMTLKLLEEGLKAFLARRESAKEKKST